MVKLFQTSSHHAPVARPAKRLADKLKIETLESDLKRERVVRHDEKMKREGEKTKAEDDKQELLQCIERLSMSLEERRERERRLRRCHTFENNDEPEEASWSVSQTGEEEPVVEKLHVAWEEAVSQTEEEVDDAWEEAVVEKLHVRKSRLLTEMQTTHKMNMHVS